MEDDERMVDAPGDAKHVTATSQSADRSYPTTPHERIMHKCDDERRHSFPPTMNSQPLDYAPASIKLDPTPLKPTTPAPNWETKAKVAESCHTTSMKMTSFDWADGVDAYLTGTNTAAASNTPSRPPRDFSALRSGT